MPGRILTLQRQVRELGRLRAGLTVATAKGGTRPTSSRNWILTSSNREYLDVAAQLWGGQVEEWQPQGNGPKAWRITTETPVIDAILPPGDPLSQHLEMWSRGGCQRRCDGEREMLSDSACLCRAQFGEDFHEQEKGTVCDIHTRLNVFLPDLPDIGVWRAESKGFWAANHIAGYVDMIKGTVGPQVLVPVRLRIEPRTKVKDGKTSQFIEVVVELRGAASFGQILAGDMPTVAIASGPDRAAIGSAPAERRDERSKLDFDVEAQAATDVATVQRLWKEARAAEVLDDQLAERFKGYAAALTAPTAPAEEPPGLDEPPADGSYTERQSWDHQIAAATTVAELREVWTGIKAAGIDDKALNAAWWARKKAIEGPSTAVAEAEVEPDKDDMWTASLRLAGELGWTTTQTGAAFREHVGKHIGDANGWEHEEFRNHLRGQLQGVAA